MILSCTWIPGGESRQLAVLAAFCAGSWLVDLRDALVPVAVASCPCIEDVLRLLAVMQHDLSRAVPAVLIPAAVAVVVADPQAAAAAAAAAVVVACNLAPPPSSH